MDAKPMTRMEQTARETGIVWKATISGDPLGLTFKGDTCSMNDLKDKATVPTEEAAKRVARALKKWIEDKYPDKEEPKGEYFVAFADGPCKVKQARRAESEKWRRKNGNHFKDQGQAHLASLAFAWLCEREREAYESRHDTSKAGQHNASLAPSGQQLG